MDEPAGAQPFTLGLSTFATTDGLGTAAATTVHPPRRADRSAADTKGIREEWAARCKGRARMDLAESLAREVEFEEVFRGVRSCGFGTTAE